VCEAQLHDRLQQEVYKCIKAGRPQEFTMEEDGTIFLEVAYVYPRNLK
jgi:hypothetical protein